MAISATVDSESMALNATVEPMLMRANAIEKAHVKKTEFTGTCHEGWTCFF